MPLYGGDGGVSFSEKQFADVRKRNEENAKREDKFSKNLLGVAGLAETFNFFINDSADKLEADGIPARAHYLTTNASAKDFNKQISDYELLGYNRQQMLREVYKNDMFAELINTFGEEANISNFNDYVNDTADKWSSNPNNLAAWNKLVDAQAKIPSLTQEEVMALIREDIGAPRTIAGFVGNGVKKWIRSHDENTIEKENNLAKDRKVGTLLGSSYDNVRQALKEFSDLGNPVGDLVDFMKTDAGKDILVFNEVQPKVLTQKKNINGVETEVQYIASVGVLPNGKSIIIGDPIEASTSVTQKAKQPYKDSEIENALDGINIYVNSSNNPFLQDAYKVYEDNPRTLATDILNTKDYIKENYGENDRNALNLATEYILSQPSIYKNYEINLFELDKIKGQGSTDAASITKYIQSIESTTDNESLRQVKLTNMRNDLLRGITLQFKDDEETMQAEILALNNIMSKVGIIPADEYNNKIIESVKNKVPQEDLTFLQELNEMPIIGDISETLFGDEFGDEILDYTVFIGGVGGILKGGQILLKAAIPAAARAVLNSSATKRSIQKILKRTQQGFKSPAFQERYKNTLNPIEKIIFESLRRKGNPNKFNTKINEEMFLSELTRMPGVYMSGFLPGRSVAGKVGWGLFGTLNVAGLFQRMLSGKPEPEPEPEPEQIQE